MKKGRENEKIVISFDCNIFNAKFMLFFRLLNSSGQRKSPSNSTIHADDMKWKGTFRNKGAILYTKIDNKLIVYVDYMFEAEIVNGTLTIEWNKAGVLKLNKKDN